MRRFIVPGLKCFIPLLKGVLYDLPKYGKHPEKYDIKLRHKKISKVFQTVNRSLNVKYIVLGKENIPNEASLFVPNHLSAADPLLMYQLFDEYLPTTFVSKIELERNSVMKNAVNAIDGLFMDRNDLRQSLKVMQKVEQTLKDKTLNWVVYAEGTRVLDYTSQTSDMHHGTFRPAVKANAPIVPIAIYGTQIILKDKPLYKSYPFIVSFLKPIYPEEYQGMKTEEIARIVKSRISKEVSFNLKRIHHEEMLKINNKKYRLNRLVS